MRRVALAPQHSRALRRVLSLTVKGTANAGTLALQGKPPYDDSCGYVENDI